MEKEIKNIKRAIRRLALTVAMSEARENVEGLMKNQRGSAGVIATIVIIVLVIVAIMMWAEVYYVSPGNVGILVLKSGQNEKGVSDKPLSPGWGFRSLFTEDVFEYPTYLQTAIWTKSSQEGSKEDESITANTKEGLAVNMDVSISYTLDPNRIPDLYVKYRAEIQRYFEENPNVYHAPKEVYEHLLPEKNYKQ